jgi:hypothetical protein
MWPGETRLITSYTGNAGTTYLVHVEPAFRSVKKYYLCKMIQYYIFKI